MSSKQQLIQSSTATTKSPNVNIQKQQHPTSSSATKNLKMMDFSKLSREELLNRMMAMQRKLNEGGAKEEISKLRTQVMEGSRAEHLFVLRLTNKQQQLREVNRQFEEVKCQKVSERLVGGASFVDRSVNLIFEGMKDEIKELKIKLDQAHKDLAAWKFTPDSQSGKRLMAKCRRLLEENEKLGAVAKSGRVAVLEGEVALQNEVIQEMKQANLETEKCVSDMDEDMESMQATILHLQQQLQQSNQQLQQSAQTTQQSQQHSEQQLKLCTTKLQEADERSTQAEQKLQLVEEQRQLVEEQRQLVEEQRQQVEEQRQHAEGELQQARLDFKLSMKEIDDLKEEVREEKERLEGRNKECQHLQQELQNSQQELQHLKEDSKQQQLLQQSKDTSISTTTTTTYPQQTLDSRINSSNKMNNKKEVNKKEDNKKEDNKSESSINNNTSYNDENTIELFTFPHDIGEVGTHNEDDKRHEERKEPAQKVKKESEAKIRTLDYDKNRIDRSRKRSYRENDSDKARNSNGADQINNDVRYGNDHNSHKTSSSGGVSNNSNSNCVKKERVSNTYKTSKSGCSGSGNGSSSSGSHRTSSKSSISGGGSGNNNSSSSSSSSSSKLLNGKIKKITY